MATILTESRDCVARNGCIDSLTECGVFMLTWWFILSIDDDIYIIQLMLPNDHSVQSVLKSITISKISHDVLLFNITFISHYFQ